MLDGLANARIQPTPKAVGWNDVLCVTFYEGDDNGH